MGKCRMRYGKVRVLGCGGSMGGGIRKCKVRCAGGVKKSWGSVAGAMGKCVGV